MEIEPRPRTRRLSTTELQRPHVVERDARLVARLAGSGVAGREHERVQDRFRTTRLARLRQADGLIRIERLDIAPHAHTFSDVFEELAFWAVGPFSIRG